MTRYVPGAEAAKSNCVEPPTTVADAAASSSTRAAVSARSPAVPVTWGATSTVTRESATPVTAKDCTTGCASPRTRTTSCFVVVAPRASATVSVTAADCSSAAPVSLCWKTAAPCGVVATWPSPESSVADSRSTGSPSGSTQSPSTGRLIVPPGATSGEGQSCWQPSTPHHTGAEFSPSPTTRSVTVAGCDISPSGLVPSVTA